MDIDDGSFYALESAHVDGECFIASASVVVSEEFAVSVAYKVQPYAISPLSLLSALGKGDSVPQDDMLDHPWKLLCGISCKTEFEKQFNSHVIQPRRSIPQSWIKKLASHVTSENLYSKIALEFILHSRNMSASDGLIPRILSLKLRDKTLCLALRACPDVSESDLTSVLVYAASQNPCNSELIKFTMGLGRDDHEMVRLLTRVDNHIVEVLLGWVENTLGSSVAPLNTWFFTDKNYVSHVEKVRYVLF